jgi:beta-mannosidase
VRYEQKYLSKDLAKLDFIFTIKANNSNTIAIKLGAKPYSFKLNKGTNVVKIPIEFNNPVLWWCNGLGAPHQYTFPFSLTYKNRILELKPIKIGLRTIELIQEKDDIGQRFYFKLNGKPIFMKGANYIPPDSFLPRVTDSIYNSIVKNAVDANMNMIRVWGGGVYADDAFYDACDKNGILVWQDFMFACAMYPSDEKFLENVKQEVIDNVNRLQNHPSIALWCGNNENDEGWKNWGWQKQYKYSESDSTEIWKGYQKLFHEVIPQTLDSLVSKEKNRYWPSSPLIGWGRKESLLQGDSHYWGVWWGMEPFEIYKKKVGRFMSEYGFQGMPNLETFSKFTNSENLNLNSEAVKAHQKHNTGYQTIQTYMERDYKVPTKFEDYIYVSQLLQAEGMKTAIEAHRRAKPYCMGTLFWQLNDCWPVTSWSSVDYFGNWKAFHYQAKRSFENILISVNEEENQYKVYIIHDELTSEKGKLEVRLIDFSGKNLWNTNSEINVEANSSMSYFEIDKKEFEKFNLKEAVLNLKFNEAVTNFYFVKPKDLELKTPTISIKVLNETTIQISTNKLAKNVFLSQEETSFNENYFDLLPNEKRIITISKPAINVKVMSLFDTMK